MSIITTTLIAIALSMDAFAVSISSGIGMAKMRLRYALRMALFFGAFQAIMPLAGWDAYSLIDLQYKDQVVCRKKPK